MSTINAKEELQRITENLNLEILEIDCSLNEPTTDSSKRLKSLNDLDIEYDNDYGFQELCGTVYCVSKDKREPVWLVRREYDGSEWWEAVGIPNYYRINNLIK